MTEAFDPQILLDTNILVYAYDADEGIKHQIAKNLLASCWNKKASFILSLQNLSEFFVTVTKKLKNQLSVEKAEEIVDDMITFSSFKKITPDLGTVQTAIALHKKIATPYYDALIVATMLAHGVHTIYTENTKDFSSIKGITVINPFLSK